MADDGDDVDDGVDDGEMITRAPSSAAMLGFTLKMPTAPNADDPDDDSEEQVLTKAGTCTLLLVLDDDGSEKAEQVPMAQTIEFVKARALALFPEALGGRGLDELHLRTGETELVNPMSLSDYPDFQPSTTVRVVCAL
mmetsp:Transcript_38073/g.81097  ORF Transcript_38073/g.81097 Transcript_38073/m.81097 type:complete len:138 (-) Transcript_38073:76-489(-)|eukprot:CAMPEP_0183339180 /NCGR_PEP_ID=MMETSP0164_2-20130417/6193_1 /TAXON_ID=221442 /ORGANISM="Coccolithus pelagicus ssp braarudi, Strain PLY182g" /LENGTH=137 /DNA_ID=CAMNT_0025509137 /DNA_START=64 /DNA_END=477 /DNA_ORIENTATION=-